MFRKLVLLALVGLVLAGCGRRNDPEFPPDTVSSPPTVPKRGTAVIYPY